MSYIEELDINSTTLLTVKSLHIKHILAKTLCLGLSETEMKNMTLGLAHGLSRYKLKFSTEKVKTMIIQV